MKEPRDTLPDMHLLLDLQVLKDLRTELLLAHNLATGRARRRPQRKEAVDARLTHLVVARTDKQTQTRREVPIRLADRALVVRGLR